MDFDFNFFSFFLHEFFSFMKHSETAFGSSMDKDKDAPIGKYKPEAMCKTYVAIIEIFEVLQSLSKFLRLMVYLQSYEVSV